MQAIESLGSESGLISFAAPLGLDYSKPVQILGPRLQVRPHTREVDLGGERRKNYQRDALRKRPSKACEALYRSPA